MSSELSMPVIGISHYGHIKQGVDDIEHTNSLSRQVEHKMQAIRILIPNSVKLYIVGHSIGSYMQIAVLKQLNAQNRPVAHSFLLMPAIDHLGSTTNATFFKGLFKIRYVIFGLLMLTSNLVPERLSKIVIRTFFQLLLRRKDIMDCLVDGVYEIDDWKISRNMMELGEDEFATVLQRDDATIGANIDRMTILYGNNDGWATKSMYESMKDTYPTADIEFLEGARHAFFCNRAATRVVTDSIVKRFVAKTSKTDVNLNFRG